MSLEEEVGHIKFRIQKELNHERLSIYKIYDTLGTPK